MSDFTPVPTVVLLTRAADAAGRAAARIEATTPVVIFTYDMAEYGNVLRYRASSPDHWRAVEATLRQMLLRHAMENDRGPICICGIPWRNDGCGELDALRPLAEQVLRDLGRDHMKQSEMPLGSVITLGHPTNQRLAAKGVNGWRLLHNGELVDPEEFRGGWDNYSPTEHPGEAP